MANVLAADYYLSNVVSDDGRRVHVTNFPNKGQQCVLVMPPRKMLVWGSLLSPRFVRRQSVVAAAVTKATLPLGEVMVPGVAKWCRSNIGAVELKWERIRALVWRGQDMPKTDAFQGTMLDLLMITFQTETDMVLFRLRWWGSR